MSSEVQNRTVRSKHIRGETTEWAELAFDLAGKAPAIHAHDDRYYTKSQVDSLVGGVDLSSRVPYTGAIQAVDLGTQNLSTAGVLTSSQSVLKNPSGLGPSPYFSAVNSFSSATAELRNNNDNGFANLSLNSLTATGNITASGQIEAGNGYVRLGVTAGVANVVMRGWSSGVLTLTNNGQNDFVRMQLGGLTAAYPSIARVGTTVAFKLADNSADAPISASTGTFSGDVNIFNTASRLVFNSAQSNASNVVSVDGNGSLTFTQGPANQQANGPSYLFIAKNWNDTAQAALEVRDISATSLLKLTRAGNLSVSGNVTASGNITVGSGWFLTTDTIRSNITSTVAFKTNNGAADASISAASGTFSGNINLPNTAAQSGTGEQFVGASDYWGMASFRAARCVAYGSDTASNVAKIYSFSGLAVGTNGSNLTPWTQYGAWTPSALTLLLGGVVTTGSGVDMYLRSNSSALFGQVNNGSQTCFRGGPSLFSVNQVLGLSSTGNPSVPDSYIDTTLGSGTFRFGSTNGGRNGAIYAGPLDVTGFSLGSGNNYFRYSNGGSNLTPNIVVGLSTGKSLALLAGTNGTAFTFDQTGTFSIAGDSKTNIDTGATTGGTAVLQANSSGQVFIGGSTDTTYSLAVSGARQNALALRNTSGPVCVLAWAGNDRNGFVALNGEDFQLNGVSRPRFSTIGQTFDGAVADFGAYNSNGTVVYFGLYKKNATPGVMQVKTGSSTWCDVEAGNFTAGSGFVSVDKTRTSSTIFETLTLDAVTDASNYRIGSRVGSAGGSTRGLVFGSYNAAGIWSSWLTAASSGVNAVSSFNVTNLVSGNPTITLRDDLNYFGLNADKRLSWSSSTGTANFFSGTVGLSLGRLDATTAAFYTTPSGTTLADLAVGFSVANNGFEVRGSNYYRFDTNGTDGRIRNVSSGITNLTFDGTGSTKFGTNPATIIYNNCITASSGQTLYLSCNSTAPTPSTSIARITDGYNGVNGLGLGSARNIGWSSDTTPFGTCDASLLRPATAQVGVRADNGLLVQNLAGTAFTPVKQGFTTLSTTPSTLDLASGGVSVYKNSGTGELALWGNDGGTMKKAALT